MTTRPSIDAVTLLTSWRRAGLLAAADTAAVAEAMMASARDTEPPLYLKILSAIGTFLATLFFVAFLAVSELISFRSGTGTLAWGVALLLAAVGLSVPLRRAEPGIGHDFLAQATFAAMAVGKVLCVAGALLIFGERTPWVATLTLLLVTAVTYPVSGASLDRVLSPYAVAASALFELLERSRGGDPSLALAAFHAVATGLAGWLLLSHRRPRILAPIGLAALGAMGTVVCIIASGHDFGIWVSHRPIDPRPIEAMLALSLVATIAWAAGGIDRLARPPLAAAALGALLLGFAGAPGIVFALLLLIVGHALHDVPLRVVGILALPSFLVLWYYGKDLTFLEKSATLVGSGALLLAARGAMHAFGWGRENAS